MRIVAEDNYTENNGERIIPGDKANLRMSFRLPSRYSVLFKLTLSALPGRCLGWTLPLQKLSMASSQDGPEVYEISDRVTAAFTVNRINAIAKRMCDSPRTIRKHLLPGDLIGQYTIHCLILTLNPNCSSPLSQR
jgi:hypothetical protein